MHYLSNIFKRIFINKLTLQCFEVMPPKKPANTEAQIQWMGFHYRSQEMNSAIRWYDIFLENLLQSILNPKNSETNYPVYRVLVYSLLANYQEFFSSEPCCGVKRISVFTQSVTFLSTHALINRSGK